MEIRIVGKHGVKLDGQPLLVVVTDAQSRHVSLQCVQGALSQGVDDCLTEAIKEFGMPRCVITDNSAIFASEQLRQRFLELGVLHLQPSPSSPGEKR